MTWKKVRPPQRPAGPPPRIDHDDGTPEWSKWAEDKRELDKERVYDHPDDRPLD